MIIQIAAAAAVLRSVGEVDGLIPAQDFLREARLIGEDEPWHIRHRSMVTKVLANVARFDVAINGRLTLPYERVIDKRTGKPGKGLARWLDTGSANRE
jgi:hypothetical protein